MPPETVRALHDLDITGPTGPEQDETSYGTIDDDDGKPARIFEPPAAPPASDSNAFDTALAPFGQFYPPPMNSFGFPGASTVPIDPMLADARVGLPAVSGPGGGLTGFEPGPWVPNPAAPGSLDNTMVSAGSLPQYNPTVPLVSGMSSFEPFVSTAWSSDGSLPSARRATMSSTLSMRGVSTPASSRSPASPEFVSGRTVEPSVASRKASPSQLGMRRAEDPHNKKKRRQSTGLTASQEKSGEQGSHRNNSLPGSSSSKAPLIAVAGPSRTTIGSSSNNNNNNNSINKNDRNKKSANDQQTMTTSSGPPGPPPPSTTTSSQQPDSRARNRAAANRCRAKSKVAVAELEATERAMSSEHQELALTARGLREEVLTLKTQLLMHGNCDDDVIQRYLANTARMVGSGVLAGAGGGGGLSSSVAGSSRMGSGFADMPPPPSAAPATGVGRGLPRDGSHRH